MNAEPILDAPTPAHIEHLALPVSARIRARIRAAMAATARALGVDWWVPCTALMALGALGAGAVLFASFV